MQNKKGGKKRKLQIFVSWSFLHNKNLINKLYNNLLLIYILKKFCAYLFSQKKFSMETSRFPC